MDLTPRHLEAEHRFRALLEAADLPAPDAVEYEPGSVLFLWHDDRLAVYVDLVDEFDEFDDVGGAGAPPESSGWPQAA